MEQRIYHGSRTRQIGDRPLVGFDVVTAGQKWAGGPLVPEAPAHFGWGRDIGGANHLAYVLLRDATGSAPLAQQHHTQFAKAVITHWHDEWRISRDEILTWLAEVVEAAAPPKALNDGFIPVPQVVRGAVRTYRGERSDNGITVTVTHVADGEPTSYPLDFETSLRMRRHSPEGFDWGFKGGASLQLALALLLDATERIAVSTQNYPLFAAQFVTKWAKDKWEITAEEILRWLASTGGFLRVGEEVRHG